MTDDETIVKRLAEAYEVAGRSPDPSNQNGAVVYNPSCTNSGHMSTGFNHFYSGIPAEVKDRKLKYERIVHAEADACLSLSACEETVCSQTVMYCPWAACKACAMAILGAGIPNLVIHVDRCEAYAATRGGLLRSDGQNVTRHWQPEVDEALNWLASGGVQITFYRGPIKAYKGFGILINSRLWDPSTLDFIV